MKRRLSPPEKKHFELAKDRRPLIKHPHAFRKGWPKKKARANRKQRAAQRALLGKADLSDLTAETIKSLKAGKPAIFKSGVMTLRERIAFNRRRRENQSS